MAQKYCVFWYPTIVHTKSEIINPLQKTIETSDDVGVRHQITLNLDPETNDLLIKSESIGRNSIEARLNFIESSRNGLHLYSYDLNSGSEEAKFIEASVDHIIYHMAKDFYHIHEINHDSDSTLRALIVKKEPNIKSIDNDALMHFLKLYEIKFIAYSKDIFFKNQYLTQQKKSVENSYLTIKEKISFLNESCENAISEYIYCKSLLNSSYNHSCKINSSNPQKRGANNDLSRVAMNIENSVRYIKFIKEKNHEYLVQKQTLLMINSLTETQTRQELTNSLIEKNDKLGKLSLGLGILSIALGVLSVILSM